MDLRIFRHISGIQLMLFVIVVCLILLDVTIRINPLSKALPRTFNNYTSEMTFESVEDVLESMSEPMTFRKGPSKSNKTATRFRSIAFQDIPPEQKHGWIRTDPEIPTSRFPKCLLVGFSKCGTSSLLSFLNYHPDVVSVDWETDYFCDRVYFKYSLHWYRMRMPLSTSSQITIEKSPCYVTERQALERIKAFNSSIKVMVILRDPLKRIQSQHGQYLASFKTGDQKRSLEDRYINPNTGKLQENVLQRWGVYTARMENLYSVFPREQIHVIDGDLFIKDPYAALKPIERFLGIKAYFTKEDFYWDPEKHFFCPRRRETNQTECMGNQKGRPHTEISFSLRTRLRNYLRPHSQRLFDVMHRNMDWDV